MRKHIHMYSFSLLFVLPPILPSANAFKHKFPDMSKGFKKSVFDNETRRVCEQKMKEPVDFKKVEKNGYYLGQALGMVWDAIVVWTASKVVSTVISEPTHPIQETKAKGGVKAVIASGTEEAITVAAPLALGAASFKAAEAGVGLGTYMGGTGTAAATAEVMPWAKTVAPQSNFCPAPLPTPVVLTTPQSAPLMTKPQMELTAAATPIMVKHSMAYYPPDQQQTITQNIQTTMTSAARAPGITPKEAAGAAVGMAAAEKTGFLNLSSVIRRGFVKFGESISWLP